MKNIRDAENLKGKKVLLRLDLNVPLKEGRVLNDFRIKKILPTIDALKQQGAKIIILSHMGRKNTDTLRPVFEYLQGIFEISFIEDIFDENTIIKIENMKNGELVLLENLIKYGGEVNNDDTFAKKLSILGDIYINESFSASHREHASIIGIPKYLPSFSGILFEEEVRNLTKGFRPNAPSIFILGGNKFKTKLPVIKKTIEKFDYVFVGGALANNFFKAQGFEIGESLTDDMDFNLWELVESNKLILPKDVVVQDLTGEIFFKKPNEVLPNEKILDAGKETVSLLKERIEEAQFILMNGPLGDYKNGFEKPTEEVIGFIADSDNETIIGGGDTTALINKLGIENEFTFVSTGGGAMLQFLLDETLPGIEALNQTKN